MTLLAPDDTPTAATVISLAEARRARGLPAIPPALPLTRRYAVGDLVRHAATGRRGVVLASDTDVGGQICEVLFYEGRADQETRSQVRAFALVLLTAAEDRPRIWATPHPPLSAPVPPPPAIA